MNQTNNVLPEERTFYYPKYVPDQQLIKGLFFLEWLLVIAPAAFGLIFFKILGLIIGIIISSGFWFLFVRMEGKRSNLAHELSCFFSFYTEQQIFRKMKRSEIKGNVAEDLIEHEEPPHEEKETVNSSKKPKKKKNSKKGNKKDQKKKEKNMEELFPFESINDGYIKMENGSIFCYFRIQANNLDLLSKADLGKMVDSFSRNLDSNKYEISFFIQDSIFKIQNNLDMIDQCRRKVRVPFLSLLLDQTRDLINEDKEDVNKKISFIRIKIPTAKVKGIKIEELQKRVLNNFHESLDPLIATRAEIKQMLAIYGNRIFTDDLPDTELKVIEKEQKSLIRKKKKEYKDTQLPGIYNFKNMIVPINTSFKPSFGKLGRNIVKTYTISSFLGTTKDMNILSRISSMKGVTTMIYFNSLKLKKYKDNASLEIRASKSTVNDELDEIDAQYDHKSLKGSYTRSREQNQKMFYISVYFQLTAKTMKDFKALEEYFLQEVDDQNLILDELETQQKDGFLTVSPIGNDRLSDFTKQNVPSESAANLYPFNEPSLLDPTGLPIGNIVNSKMMMLFDLFTYRGSNNNVLILGRSGYGKTVLLMLLLMNCAMNNHYIRNIDFEGVYKKFFERIGGINVDVSGGNEFCINPLQVRIPDKVKRSLIDDYISEVINWISVYKSSWGSNELDLFQDCLKKTYDRFNITNASDVAHMLPQDFPILSDVVETIKMERKHASHEDSIASDELYQTLIRGLNAAITGADAKLFNRHTNLGDVNINEIHSINFVMDQIMLSDKSRKLAQLMNIFTFITQFVNSNMAGDKNIVVSMDELDKCLSAEYLPIIEILNNYERRFRKRNASFVKATQAIDELDTKVDSLEAKIKPLFSQPAIKFIFHLGSIDYDKPKKLLDLTDTETNKLKEDRNGKCLMRVNQAVYDLSVMMPEWFKEVKSDVKEVKQEHA